MLVPVPVLGGFCLSRSGQGVVLVGSFGMWTVPVSGVGWRMGWACVAGGAGTGTVLLWVRWFPFGFW